MFPFWPWSIAPQQYGYLGKGYEKLDSILGGASNFRHLGSRSAEVHVKELVDTFRWENGKIGFPAVDAVMNQLTTQGWMHHLARHLAACFLTRGDLWITWEAGAAVFEKHLLDADWNINNFSWHWLSCSAFFHQVLICLRFQTHSLPT